MRALVCVATVALLSSPVRADDVEAAREHFVQGSKAFDLGLYDKAIKEYMTAYDAKPDPALLYNIAQAHKLAGHPAEALRFYRVFLMRVPEAANGDEVRAKIAELQRAIAQQQKAQTMPPDQVKPLGSVAARPAPPPPQAEPTQAEPASPSVALPAPPAPLAAPTESASSTTVAASAPGDREAAPSPGRTLKLAGIAVATVGVAALASGIGLAVEAKHDSDALTALDHAHGVYDPSQDSAGRAFGTAGPVLIGVGAAVVVAGTVVAILGVRQARRAAAAPAPSPLEPRLSSASSRPAF